MSWGDAVFWFAYLLIFAACVLGSLGRLRTAVALLASGALLDALLILG